MTVSPMDTISTGHQIGMYDTAQHAVRHVYRCNVPIADCTGLSDQHRKLYLRIQLYTTYSVDTGVDQLRLGVNNKRRSRKQGYNYIDIRSDSTLVVPFRPAYLFAVCVCISYHHLIILYTVFVQILTQIFSILFAYLLAVFFIVQTHYVSSCFVVRFCFVVCFFSFVGRTPKLADCAIVQPLCSSCALKFPYIKKK